MQATENANERENTQEITVSHVRPSATAVDYLVVLDVETTGLPRDYRAPASDHANWPRVVEVAWAVYNLQGALQQSNRLVVQPDGWTIPDAVARLHGITTADAQRDGVPLAIVLGLLAADLVQAQALVGHNLDFDERVLAAEYHRIGQWTPFGSQTRFDTMRLGTPVCAIPGRHGGYKWPKLTELHRRLFAQDFDAHHAGDDVAATARCLFAMVGGGLIRLEDL